MTFEEKFKSLPREIALEIGAHLKYKTMTEKEILSHYTTYDITSWFLNNYKQRMGLVRNENSEQVYAEYKAGSTIDELMKKFNLGYSRVFNIINNYRNSDSESKALF